MIVLTGIIGTVSKKDKDGKEFKAYILMHEFAAPIILNSLEELELLPVLEVKERNDA